MADPENRPEECEEKEQRESLERAVHILVAFVSPRMNT